MREKILWNPQPFFLFYTVQRDAHDSLCSQIEPQLKVEIEDGRVAP